VLACGRGLHGHPAQVGGELDGHPLQVAQGPEVESAGPARPPAHPRPVFPAAPPGPVRPARSLIPPGPARRIPVVVAGAEAGADGIAEPPGAHGLVAGTPGFLAEPPGPLVHPPRRLGARSRAAGLAAALAAGLAARSGTCRRAALLARIMR